ncbi:hypothetical protein KIF24_31745 [Micromonospora sp. Llam7]|nr:hypothetical protein [Micromonospora tarapacensis]
MLLTPEFFVEVNDGAVTLTFQFWSGRQLTYRLTKSGSWVCSARSQPADRHHRTIWDAGAALTVYAIVDVPGGPIPPLLLLGSAAAGIPCGVGPAPTGVTCGDWKH